MLDMLGQALAADPMATPFPVAVLRLLAACLLGGALGFEREWRSKPAGLRTHMMVAVGACLFCLLTFEIMLAGVATSPGGATRTDPIRMIEAVTAGVAFLAAGTIIRGDGRVHGLTTGAGLWVAGAVGVACGVGQLKLALFVTALVLIVMVIIRRVELWGPKKPRDD